MRYKHIHIKSIFLIVLLLFTTPIYALVKTKSIVLITSLSPIIFPIIIQEEDRVQDTLVPKTPTFLVAPPLSTSEESIFAEIHGEPNAKVYINNSYSGTIDSNGAYILTFDTSGDNGDKYFNIILKDNSNNISNTLKVIIKKISDPKYDINYKGLTLYQQDMPPSEYRLKQLTDTHFNLLDASNKLQVANKLLATLFFGYPQKILKDKIDSGNFLQNIQLALQEEHTDKDWLENYILDDNYFEQYNRWNEPQVITILSRFYAMKNLDRYFLKNWTAYILTQTIMFSPAYELESTHTPNIANVYNRMVTFLNENSGMRYISYVHMMSEDNWRRFRSPEDNGREMLEIFHFDMNDSHVPIAGQALQNWKLNTDNDTLEVSLNQNRQPLNLFGTIIVNGDDFYRELVKSPLFIQGVTKRLVDFFFPQSSIDKKSQISHAIITSNPETWNDILLQIVFSEEYLLDSKRAKSAEETFYSLAKKMNFKHRKNTFFYLKNALDDMHQASMKYKLGKLHRVPLDTLSFAYYHKYIREHVLLKRSNPDNEDIYDAWSRQGWDKSFTSFENFIVNNNMIETSLDNFINYIFQTIISRKANDEELAFFRQHMIYEKNGKKYFYWAFNMFAENNDLETQMDAQEERKSYIAYIVLDYISRLDVTYQFKEAK